MNTESNLNQHSIENQIPIVELNKDGFSFIEETETEKQEVDAFLPSKSYEEIFEDEKQKANSAINIWWQMDEPDMQERNLVFKFGKRMKPYLHSLLEMNEKKIPLKTLNTLYKEVTGIGKIYLPVDDCPIFFPPINFYIIYLEEGLKDFFQKKVSAPLHTVQFKICQTVKAKLEIMLEIIDQFKVTTSSNWFLL